MAIPDAQKIFFQILDKGSLTDLEICRTTERPKVSHQTLSEARHGKTALNGRTFQSLLRAVEKLRPGWAKGFYYEMFLRCPGGLDARNEVDDAIAFLEMADFSKEQMKRFLDISREKILAYYPPTIPPGTEVSKECCTKE